MREIGENNGGVWYPSVAFKGFDDSRFQYSQTQNGVIKFHEGNFWDAYE